MTTEADLIARAGSKCELCGAADDLAVHEVSHAPGDDAEALLCGVCRAQIADPAAMDPAHWRPLADTMWTPVPAVQVLAWRMLDRMRSEAWAAELLEMLYLDEDAAAWAEAGASAPASTLRHVDSNGAPLAMGDTVTLIKDLTVKGANFTAKRGTSVRVLMLDPGNEKHIEGRVNGQRIVILCEFVKKS